MNDLNKEFSEILITYLIEKNSKKLNSLNKLNRELNYFSVSQSSYDCYLKQYFDIMNPVIDSTKLGTFAIGDKIHELVQDAFISDGAVSEISCKKEYNFKPDTTIYISGHADLIYNNKVNGKPLV